MSSRQTSTLTRMREIRSKIKYRLNSAKMTLDLKPGVLVIHQQAWIYGITGAALNNSSTSFVANAMDLNRNKVVTVDHRKNSQ